MILLVADARISRDLHDMVGHSIALMTVQAGAERLALGDSEAQTSQVLQQIETTGRQAMQEMRRLLDVMRGPEEDVDLDPPPGLGQLDTLVDAMARAGVEVRVRVVGNREAVLPSVDTTAYRIVQEALTNVLRHADATRATVLVEHAPTCLVIEVTDDGHGRTPSNDGTGHGTAGMRERAAMYGGSVEVGPAPGGGWRVHATLPQEPVT